MRNQLHCADCLVELPKLVAGSVNLCIDDPPFNIDFDYKGEYDDDRSPSEYLAWAERWLSEIYRVLAADGTFWLVIGPAYVSEMDVLAKRLGFHKRSHLVWFYTFGVNSVKKFTPSHTHLLYFTKSKTNFTFNVDQLKVPSARQMVYNDKRAKAGGRLPDDVWILRPQWLGPEGFPPTGDVWHIPRVAGTFKQRQQGAANQLPEHLIGRIIRGCSNPGDLVLDPMVGTGTVLAVAKKLGRDYLGFEKSKVFADLAGKRVKTAHLGDPLDGEVPQGG